jgi:hypothetical protein
MTTPEPANGSPLGTAVLGTMTFGDTVDVKTVSTVDALRAISAGLGLR